MRPKYIKIYLCKFWPLSKQPISPFSADITIENIDICPNPDIQIPILQRPSDFVSQEFKAATIFCFIFEACFCMLL